MSEIESDLRYSALRQKGFDEAQAAILAQQLADRPSKDDIRGMIRDFELSVYRRLWIPSLGLLIAIAYRLFTS
ncbi:MAG: hypothetical protein OXP36_11335 [Gammaproteobacteria bacterium]|nr:hypothetical protein [Gammaproteobacteria bacterium]